jgi:hypothetical protein
VEVDVLVKGQDHTETMCSQKCDALAQHQYQYEHAVKIQALSCKTTEDAKQMNYI